MQNRQYLTEISRQRAEAIQEVISLNFDKLTAIAHMISNENDLNEESIMRILTLETERSIYKRMGFASLDGATLTTDHENMNIFDRDYFQEALKGNNSISDKIIDKIDGKAINVYAVPLYHEDKVYGVIFATCPTEIFTDILSTPLFGENGYIYIVNIDGYPIVNTGAKQKYIEFNNLFEEITADTEDLKIMQENMRSGRAGIIEYNRNMNDNIAAYCKVDINDWYLVSVVPKNVVSQSANKIMYRNTALSFIIILLFLIFLSYLFCQQRKINRRLERIAYFDELIGFPNYNSFLEKSQDILKSNTDKQFAFVMLDVDNFKLINEQLGFDTGNRVLKNIAVAISEGFGDQDEIFARISVDEFIIMLNYKSADYLKDARKLFERRFWELMGKDFDYYIKFPTGRYIADKGEISVNRIYEKVNYAHRKAKQLLNEKNGIYEYFYDDNEKERALRKIDIENRMRSAIINKEFKVYLQPKYLLKNETIVGAEALVRWQAADGKVVLPDEFIPIFEQNGFVIELDMYIVEEVCKIIKHWIDTGKPIVPVSVNFSRLHLLHQNFINNLVSVTNLYNVPRKYIEIELTESIISENDNLIINVLQQAHEFGFLLSMDDFGSGYSSLGLLKNLPVDIIKIDRSFFNNSMYNRRAKNVVEAIMLMAQKLNVQTVAEGIENADQVKFLREIGCDIVQGYYYAKPMLLRDFNDMISEKDDPAS